MRQPLSILLLLTLISCTPPTIGDKKASDKETSAQSISKNNSSRYVLAFSKIDNSVNVFVEDSLIFTSGTIHDSPEVNFEVDFTSLVQDGAEMVKIELWNGVEPYNEQIDPLWEVKYDLIINGEIVDFVHEYDDDNSIGLVYENTYQLSDWK